MSKWSSAYRDSRWQKLRLEVLSRDNWTCRRCGKGTDSGVSLNVHHAFYESGHAPWEYEPDTLFTLCQDCHGKIHEELKRLSVAFLEAAVASEIPGLALQIQGYIDAQGGRARSNKLGYLVGYTQGQVDIWKEDDQSPDEQAGAGEIAGGACS